MNEYLNKIDDYIQEVKKLLSLLTVNDTSSSSLKLVEAWLMQIKRLFMEFAKTAKSPESTPEARAQAEAAKLQTPQNKAVTQEMTSMAGGDAAGVAGGLDLGTDKELDEENEEDEDSLFIKEGTLPLRKIIRSAIHKLYENTKSIDFTTLFEEFSFDEPPQVGEPVQQKKVDTGTGLADAVFKSIASNIEDQFNLLKTSEAQRQSFTQHLVRALQVGMSQLQAEFSANRLAASGEGKIETKTADKSKQDQFARDVQIPGLDETGKGFAFKTYKEIFTKISTALNGDESVSGLNDLSDRESFMKVIIERTQQLCKSLEEHMKPAAPNAAPAPEIQKKTNANSNFLLP